MDANQSAREFDPSRHLLYPTRPMTFNGVSYTPGDGKPLPMDGDVTRLRQLVRVKLAKVVDGARSVPAVVVATGEREGGTGFVCPKCSRTFKSKVNLGAHLRSHKGK